VSQHAFISPSLRVFWAFSVKGENKTCWLKRVREKRMCVSRICMRKSKIISVVGGHVSHRGSPFVIELLEFFLAKSGAVCVPCTPTGEWAKCHRVYCSGLLWLHGYNGRPLHVVGRRYFLPTFRPVVYKMCSQAGKIAGSCLCMGRWVGRQPTQEFRPSGRRENKRDFRKIRWEPYYYRGRVAVWRYLQRQPCNSSTLQRMSTEREVERQG